MMHFERRFLMIQVETAAAKNMSVMDKNNANDASNRCWLAIKLPLILLRRAVSN